MTITLAVFVAEERMKPIDFHEYWALKHRENGDEFPLELASEMWPVHYRIWERERADDG